MEHFNGWDMTVPNENLIGWDVTVPNENVNYWDVTVPNENLNGFDATVPDEKFPCLPWPPTMYYTLRSVSLLQNTTEESCCDFCKSNFRH